MSAELRHTATEPRFLPERHMEFIILNINQLQSGILWLQSLNQRLLRLEFIAQEKPTNPCIYPKSVFMNKISTPSELQAALEKSRHYAVLSLRIAFGFSMILCLFALYLYITVTPEKLFSKNFHPYELHTMRGSSNSSAIREAYTTGKMDSVIWEFNSLNAPQPEEYLLAGKSHAHF